MPTPVGIGAGVGRAEAILIHEVLHTLGLREDPPASFEITRVIDHCGRAAPA